MEMIYLDHQSERGSGQTAARTLLQPQSSGNGTLLAWYAQSLYKALTPRDIKIIPLDGGGDEIIMADLHCTVAIAGSTFGPLAEMVVVHQHWQVLGSPAPQGSLIADPIAMINILKKPSRETCFDNSRSVPVGWYSKRESLFDM